jgi:hypothetical protein
MKKLSLLVLSIFMLFAFSFNIIHVQAKSNDADKLVQIKEIRKSIRHHLKANERQMGARALSAGEVIE